MPARPRTARAVLPHTRPVPCGAGLMVTSVEAHLPVILYGRDMAGAPDPDFQEPEPRLASMRLILARSMARLIVGPTSLPLAMPRPTKPSRLPVTAVMLKRTRRPESVMRWTMLMLRTSSAISGSRASTISGSRSGSLVASASLIVLTWPPLTSLPRRVLGSQGSFGSSSRRRRAPPGPPRAPPGPPGRPRWAEAAGRPSGRLAGPRPPKPPRPPGPPGPRGPSKAGRGAAGAPKLVRLNVFSGFPGRAPWGVVDAMVTLPRRQT